MTAPELLDRLTDWCIDHLDGPTLVGVVLGHDTVTLDPIVLDPTDPVADARSLVASEHWDAAVIVVDTRWVAMADAGASAGTGVVGVGMTRTGAVHVEMRTDGQTTRIDGVQGRLVDFATELFDDSDENGA